MSARTVFESVFTDRRSHRLALGPGLGAANHCSTWNSSLEIHISWRSRHRDLADRSEGANRDWLALRPFPARACALAVWTRGPAAFDFVRLLFEGRGQSDSLCAATRRNESAAQNYSR